MAQVSGNVIGNLSGKIGNLSAKTVKGKTILTARPSSFRVSNDPRSLEIRSCFKTSVDIAKNVMGLPVLDRIWEKIKPSDMSVYNLLIKMNFDFSSKDGPTTNNIITPDGFSIPVTASSLTAETLSFELDALDTAGVFEDDEIDLSINSLVVLKNSVDARDKPYRIIKFNKEEVSFDFSELHTATFDLDVMQKNLVERYQEKIIYLAVATRNAEGDVVQCSATYAVKV